MVRSSEQPNFVQLVVQTSVRNILSVLGSFTMRKPLQEKLAKAVVKRYPSILDSANSHKIALSKIASCVKNGTTNYKKFLKEALSNAESLSTTTNDISLALDTPAKRAHFVKNHCSKKKLEVLERHCPDVLMPSEVILNFFYRFLLAYRQ